MTEKFLMWSLSLCLDWDSYQSLSRNKDSIPGTRLRNYSLGNNDCGFMIPLAFRAHINFLNWVHPKLHRSLCLQCLVDKQRLFHPR